MIQIGLIILAIKFTAWYPDCARARAGSSGGPHSDPALGRRSLLPPLTGYISSIGIVLLIVGGTPWWVGTGLIVFGAYVTRALYGNSRVAEPRRSDARAGRSSP